MADLYVAMYAPLVGNHEHWNLQVVVKDKAGPSIPPINDKPSGHDIATDFVTSVLQESRKRKSCSSSDSSSSSSRHSPGNEVHGRPTDVTSKAAERSQHEGKVTDEDSGPGDSSLRNNVTVTTATTIYEVLNQHPDFIASKTVTTSIAPLASTSTSRLPRGVPTTGPNTAYLGRNPDPDISTSKGVYSRPNPASQVAGSPTASNDQDIHQHVPSTSSSPYGNPEISPSPSLSSACSPSSPLSTFPPQLRRYPQRPPLNRLLHLTPLNPLDLYTIDETARQAKVDNETIHWNCQDYVMEILEALERECVIDLESEPPSDSDSSHLDSDALGDDDPDTPLEETGDEGTAGGGEEDGEHGVKQISSNLGRYQHEKDTRDRSLNRESDSSRRSAGQFAGQEQGRGSHYYAKQKRRLMRYFGPII